MPHDPAARRGWLSVCMISGAAAITGCAGAGVGSDLSARPTPMDLGAMRGEHVSLPADAPFSITLAPTQEAPGLDGKADADASVAPGGKAELKSIVSNGGAATSELRLGHSFRNDTSQQVDLSVAVSLGHRFKCQATPAGPNPESKVNLVLFARDDRSRVLREYKLVDLSSDQGDATGQRSETLDFTVTLAPGARVDVFLSGLAKVDAALGHSGVAELGIESIKMDVTRRLAPAASGSSVAPEPAAAASSHGGG